MSRRQADLVATVVLAAASAIVVTRVPDLRALRTAFALPLLLGLPGYGLAAALFPAQAIDWPRRLLLSVGLSLSEGIVVGLVLDLTPLGLRSASWAFALFAITAAACVFAAERRRREGTAAPAVSILRVRVRDAVLLLLAASVLAAAVGLARTPLPAKNVQGYTALWLLPGTGRDGARTVRLGVTSGELVPMRYRLVLRVGQRIAFERRLPELQPGQQIEESVPLGGGASAPNVPVEALLYRQDRPQSIYRLARL